MRLLASDIYRLHVPETCELRIHLLHKGEPEAEPGPFDLLIKRLGQQHEMSHRAALEPVLDLSRGSEDERLARTAEAVNGRVSVLYQPLLAREASVGGVACRVVGVPDFLILSDGCHVVRDSKLARRINEDDHPEILLQMDLYGWLYEQLFGNPPLKLEVHSGTGQIVELPYQGGGQALKELETIVTLRSASAEPYSPVGWSKCGGCGYHDRCWPLAEKRRDVALLPSVDQGLARALREEGVHTYDEILERFTEGQLAEFQKPWGTGRQRVGKRAGEILRSARAMVAGREEFIKTPVLPASENYAMFDLEGLPPYLDELEKIYLWGLQVFGAAPSGFLPACAGFGEQGNRDGWELFLRNAGSILEQYGDIPFVHWHNYERRFLQEYMRRYGDRGGIGVRVLENLLDLHPTTKAAVALPIPSYSLKVVEKHIGYSRTNPEADGEWAMAKYIEATESRDEQERVRLMEQICSYNREDLEATWAVFRWLQEHCR